MAPKKTLSERGFTLTEAVVAFGILAVIALTSQMAVRQVSTVAHSPANSCHLNNLKVLNLIRSVGAASQVGNYNPVTTADTVTASTNNLHNTYGQPLGGIPDSQRWPTLPIVALPAGATSTSPLAPYVNNYLLVGGYMPYIQAMYRSISGVCVDKSGPGQFPTSQFISLKNNPQFNSLATSPVPTPTDVSIQKAEINVVDVGVIITPYSLVDGSTMQCAQVPPNVEVAPKGDHDDSDPQSPFYPTGNVHTQQAQRSPGVTVLTNVGFTVSVVTKYQTPEDIVNNVTESCTTQQKFQYPTDTSTPPIPDSVSLNLVAGSMPLCSSISTNSYQLKVGYLAGTNAKAGTVFLCRDESVMPLHPNGPYVSANALPPSTETCFQTNNASPVVGAPQISINSPGTNYYPVGQSGLDFSTTAPAGPAIWTACQNLTLCGVAGVAVAANGNNTVTGSNLGNTATSLGYTINYSNLPSDCRVLVEVEALDTSGNISGLYQSPSYGETTSDTASNWDIPRPQCRNYCTYAGTMPFPTGYYTCAAACP